MGKFLKINTRILDSGRMNNTKTKAMILFTILTIFMISSSSIYIHEAEAGFPGVIKSETMLKKEVYYLNGDLTAPKDDKPYGGDIVGNYLITVNFNDVKIIAEFDATPSQDQTLWGWLVDVDGESYLRVGQFNSINILHFNQEDMEDKTYEQFIVTEEPIRDTNPSIPHLPVGGTLLSLEIHHADQNRHE